MSRRGRVRTLTWLEMRILILSQHFTPEVTAARARVHAFAQGLADRGHEVEVLCEVPNHPEGIVRPGYGGRATIRRTLDGFEVRYLWVRASPRKTLLSRLLLYGTYAAMASGVGATLARPDVILASSPPLPTGAAAALLAIRHRVPWVLDVRDLWPEAAVILGELTDARAVRAAEWLEQRLYRSAAAITTVTEPFREQISDRIGDPEKTIVIPNGTSRLWLETGESEVERSTVGLPGDRFIWAYGGNLGIAQGLETAIEAAASLDEGFQLVLLGGGPMRQQLEQQATSLPPGSVTFHDPVQPEVAARYLRAADALLVPLDTQPALEKFVPSKLFDCCALGRPVIVAAAGEASRLASTADAALVVPPGDPQALADAVRALRSDTALRDRLAAAGRSFAAEYLRERQIERLEGVLKTAI